MRLVELLKKFYANKHNMSPDDVLDFLNGLCRDGGYDAIGDTSSMNKHAIESIGDDLSEDEKDKLRKELEDLGNEWWNGKSVSWDYRFKHIEHHGGEGEGELYYDVVFDNINKKYYRINGCYYSHDGVYWDEDWSEVRPHEVTVIEYY